MGEAMLRGLARAGVPADRLRAYDPRQDRLRALAAEIGFTAEPDLGVLVAGADLLVLATKPQSFGELLPQVARHLGPRTAVLSIAAGVTLARLQAALGPSTPLVRVMPNTPGLIGQGVSALCLGSASGEAQADLARQVLAPLGTVLQVREEQMDAVTALSGSGPAYLFAFMEALQAAGERLGLEPETAFNLASQTLVGASAMVARREKTPPELRAAVTSPGGTTAAALQVFDAGGFGDLVLKALTAARDRGAELGQAR